MRSGWQGLLCRWLVLALLVGRGDAVASDAIQAYLRAANFLYQQLEYEQALEQLKRAHAASSGVDDDVQILLWEGILFREMAREDEARNAFNTALALQPDAQLPVRVSPKMAEQFEAHRVVVKKQLARSETPSNPGPAAVVVPPSVSPKPVRVLPVTLLGVGAAGALVGAVLVGMSLTWNSAITQMDFTTAREARDTALVRHDVGIAVLTVGGAAAATGAVLLLLAPSNATKSAIVVPTAGGAVVSFGGRF